MINLEKIPAEVTIFMFYQHTLYRIWARRSPAAVQSMAPVAATIHPSNQAKGIDERLSMQLFGLLHVSIYLSLAEQLMEKQ